MLSVVRIITNEMLSIFSLTCNCCLLFAASWWERELGREGQPQVHGSL